MDTDDLDLKKRDVGAAFTRSVVGAVPFAGQLLTEIIDNLIPNQRLDRLTKFVVELDKRLSGINSELIREFLQDEECISLFEEGFLQASRAVSDKRREKIAEVVCNGLGEDAIQYGESKYVLKILEELNELEVIWLRFFLHPELGGDKQFRDKHAKVLVPVPAYIGSDEATLEKAALQRSYKEHLERLGLLQAHIKMDRDTGLPEFDQVTGTPKTTHRNVTPLGRLILKQIGLIKPEKD